MNQCSRCRGFVPSDSKACPNCRSRRALWMAPLGFLGAGLATITLAACYGPPCASRPGKLPDGGRNDFGQCGFDCTQPLPDGGGREQNLTWVENCEPFDCSQTPVADGGAYVDAWKAECRYQLYPDGGPIVGPDDAGIPDAGTDGGN